MYQRGMDGIGTQGLSGLFDSIANIAGQVAQGATAAQQIAAGTYTPYPGSPPVLYASPSYAPPAPAPASSSGSGISTTLLLGSAAVLVGVLFMMRRGRR